MKEKIYNLAFDFGASGGRLMMGAFDGERVELTELHRFPNEPVQVNGRLMWDVLRLFHEMKEGMKKAAALHLPFEGIGIDTWGVDYGLLDAGGNLIGAPINYRDARTEGIMDEVAKIVPLAEIYRSTGIQFMPFNTIFQLYADRKMRPAAYDNAETLLFMPDLFAYFLTGKKICEYTNASTSQLLDVAKRDWDKDLAKRIGLRTDMLQELTEPGTMIGTLTAEVQQETGLGAVPVIAVGSHDTASAVAGTPFEDSRGAAFLSSGTWSLLGVERDAPIVTDEAFESNFTNEGGVENTIRFLKNINGLWILQQLRKSWNATQKANLGFGDIVAAARNAKNKNLIINPSNPIFLAPPNMVGTITHYCERDQGTPMGIGELAMAVYNGLAREYRAHVDTLARLVKHPIPRINMIGGGTQDALLCEMTAYETGREVCAGPIEGSVLGNILMQWKAGGHISGLAEGRAVIKRSFEQKIYKASGQ